MCNVSIVGGKGFYGTGSIGSEHEKAPWRQQVIHAASTLQGLNKRNQRNVVTWALASASAVAGSLSRRILRTAGFGWEQATRCLRIKSTEANSAVERVGIPSGQRNAEEASWGRALPVRDIVKRNSESDEKHD